MLATLLTAQAQDNKNDQAKESEQAPVIGDEAIKLLLDKIEVSGQLERPQAVFFVPGNDPEIDDIQIERSFFNQIFRPVEKKGRFLAKIETVPTKNRKDYIPW